MSVLLCNGLACEAEPSAHSVPAPAETDPPEDEVTQAPERGQWRRERPSEATLRVDATGWEWSTSTAAPTRAPAEFGTHAKQDRDALDFGAQLQLARRLGLEAPAEGVVALRSAPGTSMDAFIFSLETLAKSGVHELRWRPEDGGEALELSLELPRYRWSAETTAAEDDPSQLVLALRGSQVIAGLRPLAYFAQDRIAGDVAAISNRKGEFRTQLEAVALELPLVEWLTQLCRDAKDARVHVGLSIDASGRTSDLWMLAGQIESPPGCEVSLQIDASLPERPEGNNPNLHVFADAQRIVDLTRPAEPRVRLHPDRFRNAALQPSDQEAILAREPELMMTVTTQEGRPHLAIRRSLWAQGRSLNDCYRDQRERTPLWAPHVVATGMLRAPKRKPYVSVEGLEHAPEFAACIKQRLEQPGVSEMDRLLGFRAEMDFLPFGGVIHD